MSREFDRLQKEVSQEIDNLKQINREENGRLESNLGKMVDEQQRVTEIYRAPAVIIEDLDSAFKKATKLDKRDIAFLFLAVAMQCVRQYVLKPLMDTERTSDKDAAKKTDKPEEHSDRSHRLYNPSLEEILTNPVPFDANIGSKGALKGGGWFGHRGVTPGHDPVFGLVFGTANIATSTLTTWGMQSWHIKTMNKQDSFGQRAKTNLVLSNTIDKLLHQGTDGKILVGSSIVKEIVHLRSDVSSHRSLPLPGISAISPEMAAWLAEWGLDMAGVIDAGKQMVVAMAIDTMIAFIHGLFYEEGAGPSRDLYQVKTRRILTYSNLIASASNVIVSSITAYLGGKEKARKIIDWGGYLNTIRRIALDSKFIGQIKREFLRDKLYERITGSQYDFMEGK